MEILTMLINSIWIIDLSYLINLGCSNCFLFIDILIIFIRAWHLFFYYSFIINVNLLVWIFHQY